MEKSWVICSRNVGEFVQGNVSKFALGSVGELLQRKSWDFFCPGSVNPF